MVECENGIGGMILVEESLQIDLVEDSKNYVFEVERVECWKTNFGKWFLRFK